MRNLKSTLRLLLVVLLGMAMIAPALPSPTTAGVSANNPTPFAPYDSDYDDDSDDDDSNEDRAGRRDPCSRTHRRGRRHDGPRRRCLAGSSSGIARGDFNGDGIGDLAVGVPFEDALTASGVVIQDSGGVNIIYGSVAGLSATAGPGDQLLVYTRVNGRAGSALASGDFDGDGYSDLAIGAPFDDVPISDSPGVVPFTTSDGTSNTFVFPETPPQQQVQDAGRVHIFYGSPNGLDIATWESLNLGNISGSVPHTLDEFGAALAWGDFDGDSFGDLAVGIPGHNLQAGAVGVFRGSADGLRGGNRASTQLWTQNSNGILDSEEAGDRFGSTLASGEFGLSAGVSDLAVGAPGEDLSVTTFGSPPVTTTLLDAGAVHVIYGSNTAFPAGLTAAGSQFWSQNSRQVESGAQIADFAEEDDRFGSALASFGLGSGDLAIGVPGEDVGAIPDAGAVNVIYFDPAVNQLSFPNNQLWTQNSVGDEELAEEGDQFGLALAGGDFDGNTLKDLAIGAPGETLSNQLMPLSNAGAVHVIYYHSIGTGLSATAGPGYQIWTQNSASILSTAEAGERFGSALTAWDFGNGFLADLAVGVPFQSVKGLAGAGAVNVIYGDNTSFIPGLRATGNQFWTQDSLNIEGGAEAGDQFGRALY